MIPVLLVLVWILGTMVAIGYALNVFTILIGALTVGLGVTYAIHISHRFIEEMEHHHSLEKAVNNTVKNTGSALFGAAMTTVLGFGVLFFAILPPMKQFGTMTALTIFYSFLSSVWVLPSILVLWARYTNLGKENNERHDHETDNKDEDILET
jgi:predicted RND superfamily exporter protein